MTVRPAKTQISLGIRPVWSEFSLCAQWVGKDLSFLHADSEDSDQTGRTPRLIWVFAGHTTTLLVLSCRGLFIVHVHEPRHEKMCLRESLTRQDTNWSAQLQRPARILKFRRYRQEVSFCLGSRQQRHWSDCADVQADLRLCCSHMA